jgi:hypothetical protein
MASIGKDYKKEWFEKAKVDYFSPFVNLWLACNSWYNFHYSLSGDRPHVNKLKTDFGNSNKLYKNFEKIYANGDSKNEKSFLALLELLHFSLNQAQIKPEKFHTTKYLSLSCMLIDYNKINDCTGYVNAVLSNALTAKGKLKSNVNGIILGSNLVFNANTEIIFSGLIETIYQVRCMLVHGELSPTDENHEVVKYCYLVLYEMMKDFCA